MVGFLITIHVLVCVLLVITILLQSSRGGGLAGLMGGMGAVFGGRGAAPFLSKVTLWLAIAFGVTSISIAFFSSGKGSRPKSAIQQVIEQEGTSPSDILPTVPGATEETSR